MCLFCSAHICLSWFERETRWKSVRNGVCIRGLGYNFSGADDKAVGGRAEVVERETGDEGERATGGGIEDFDLAGGNDLRGFDEILKIAGGGLEADAVANLNVAERAEESVAVTSEGDVSRCSGQSGFGNMTYGAAQNSVGIALHDDSFEVETRNLDFADDATFDKGRRRCQLRTASSLPEGCFKF